MGLNHPLFLEFGTEDATLSSTQSHLVAKAEISIKLLRSAEMFLALWWLSRGYVLELHCTVDILMSVHMLSSLPVL